MLTQKCQHLSPVNYGPQKCLKTVKHIIDGVGYCGIHNPCRKKIDKLAMVWVSVKNRLPTKEGTYFTHYQDGRIGTGTFFFDAKRFNRSNSGGVIHWMPIPEPPKENV